MQIPASIATARRPLPASFNPVQQPAPSCRHPRALCTSLPSFRRRIIAYTSLSMRGELPAVREGEDRRVESELHQDVNGHRCCCKTAEGNDGGHARASPQQKRSTLCRCRAHDGRANRRQGIPRTLNFLTTYPFCRLICPSDHTGRRLALCASLSSVVECPGEQEDIVDSDSKHEERNHFRQNHRRRHPQHAAERCSHQNGHSHHA